MLEDACLYNWRETTVEVGLLSDGATGGATTFHGSLKHHDETSLLLATESGLGLLLISRRSIAFVRPTDSQTGPIRRTGHRQRQGAGHR